MARAIARTTDAKGVGVTADWTLGYIDTQRWKVFERGFGYGWYNGNGNGNGFGVVFWQDFEDCGGNPLWGAGGNGHSADMGDEYVQLD